VAGVLTCLEQVLLMHILSTTAVDMRSLPCNLAAATAHCTRLTRQTPGGRRQVEDMCDLVLDGPLILQHLQHQVETCRMWTQRLQWLHVTIMHGMKYIAWQCS
jgi:hypothetical protein